MLPYRELAFIPRLPVFFITSQSGLKDYIKIHLQNERPLLALMTMKAMLEKLPADKFARIHRSYIIQTEKVKAVTGKKIILNTGTEIPLNDSYIDYIQKWIDGSKIAITIFYKNLIENFKYYTG